MNGAEPTSKRFYFALASAAFASFFAIAVYGFFLYPLKSESPSTLVTFINDAAKLRFLAANGLGEADLKPLPGVGAYVVSKPKSQLIQAAEDIKLIPNQRYAALLTPNDPIYPQWYTDKISAPSAWDITTGSSGVTVAVIDTGFALSHEDLAGRWAENAGEQGSCGGSCDKSSNGVDDDGNGLVDDWRGWDFLNSDNSPIAGATDPNGAYVSHGTLVAGLVGATGNNAKGVAGPNWGAKILPLQVLGDDGVGYTSEVATAIRYAADRGAKVISLSLGSSNPDQFLRDQISYAIGRGAVVIAAAGNSGCDCMVYPANYQEVVAVGATDQNDNRASFSSYGANLDIMAPGAGTIRTTYWSSANQTNLYTSSANGTSISTPIAAGIIALILSINPSAPLAQVNTYLIDGADKLPGMAGATRTDLYGSGRVNAVRSLEMAAALHPDGTLIEIGGRVFLIESGQRRHITTGAIFSSYGYQWNRIKPGGFADSQLTEGSPIKNYREGTLIHSNGSIYIIDNTANSQVKRHISNWETFIGLGYTLNEVFFVSPAELPVDNGTPVSSNVLHPDGTLINIGNRVFLIDSSQRRHITTGFVFLSHAYRWEVIKRPSSGDYGIAEVAAISSYREGALLHSNGRIYIVDVDNSGTIIKRHMKTWECFAERLGFRVNEVQFVTSDLLPVADGSPIDC
jgi:subtilisin family serine protease